LTLDSAEKLLVTSIGAIENEGVLAIFMGLPAEPTLDRLAWGYLAEVITYFGGLRGFLCCWNACAAAGVFPLLTRAERRKRLESNGSVW